MEAMLLNPPYAAEHLSPGLRGAERKPGSRRAGQVNFATKLKFGKTVADKYKAQFPLKVRVSPRQNNPVV